MRARLGLLGAALAALTGCSAPATPAPATSITSASPSATTALPALPSAAATSTASPEATPSVLPASGSTPPPHIMVVVLENREYGSVIGPAARLTELARSHGLATQAYAMSHPSEPNYIALITGSTQGISDDGDHLVVAPSLAGQLRARGIGWRAYMGGLPRPCDPVVSAGLYAKKHDPFLMVREVASDPAMCASVVPGTSLARDLSSGAAPPFLFVSPDVCADGHSCSTADADAATAALVSQVTASPWYASGGAIVILWDEGSSSAGCCSGARGGHVAVIVVSSSLRAGTTLDSPLDHAGVLRAIEEAYGLPLLGDAACTCSGDLLPLLRPRT